MEIKTRKKKKKFTQFGLDVTNGEPLPEHYSKVSLTPKGDEVSAGGGFFDVPTEIRGKTDFGIKKFLVFYFENVEDFERCVAQFSKYKKPSKRSGKNPPIVDTKKLMRLLNKNG